MQSVVGEFCAQFLRARKKKTFFNFRFYFPNEQFRYVEATRKSRRFLSPSRDGERERDSMAGGRKCVRIEIMAHHNDDGENVGKEEKRVVGL